MALLRPGRWGSRPQGGCLQHRTEAQRRPKGQDAGGTPALPGDPGRGGSFESETRDYCGLSGARTLSGEAGWRQTILFILSIHVNQGLTHARRRDQTLGTSLRDFGVTSCPFVDNPSIGFKQAWLARGVMLALPWRPSWNPAQPRRRRIRCILPERGARPKNANPTHPLPILEGCRAFD